MGLVWTPVATVMILVSTIATFFTMVHMRVRWDVHTSSVRWLFWLFFVYVFVWCAMRSVYYVWLCLLPEDALVDVRAPRHGNDNSGDDSGLTVDQLDRLGIHAILHLQAAKTPLITMVLCMGDVAMCGVAMTVFPLTYELWKIARMSMDCGIQKEKRQIQIYVIGIHVVVVLFAMTELVLCLVFDGYNVYTQRCMLGVYCIEFVALAVMAAQLLMLKVNGRKYETIQGAFVASPVYQRLKAIMLVYAFFSFQYQLSTVIIYLCDPAEGTGIVEGVGISLIVYNASGLALSVITSCSQACVFSACATCLPEDFEAQYQHRRFKGPSAAPLDADLDAPTMIPVFVYTDIESSSALWSVEVGEMMERSTEIHDTILRSTLPKYHGYEIATVGDAFQVAFHTIRDAVEYCMDVQLQLMVAKWPKELHDKVPATVKQRVGRRVIFNGLRVRMGIHDALDSDGTMVQDVHVVTGKTVYSGVSEMIAEYVGDLGSGGQILTTARVATWLKHHREDLSVDIFMERVGHYTVPQLNANVELFQLLPAMLAARAQFFEQPKGRVRHEMRFLRRGLDLTLQRQLQRHVSMPVMLPSGLARDLDQ